MSDLKAGDILTLLKEAELIGALKTLTWLSFEFSKDMTVDDIEQTVHYALGCIYEEVWNGFNQQHAIFTHLEDRIKKRTQAATAMTPEAKKDP